MQQIIIAFFVLIITVGAYASDVKVPVKLDNAGFQGVLADAGKVLISGQPTLEGINRLKAQGVTTIINFRTPREMDNREIVPFDESEEAEKLGITYIHVPLGGEAHPYTPEALEKFATAMSKVEGKALIHCTVGWRASHVWSAYLTKYEGMEVNEALAHGRAANMGFQPFEALLGGVTYKVNAESQSSMPMSDKK